MRRRRRYSYGYSTGSVPTRDANTVHGRFFDSTREFLAQARKDADPGAGAAIGYGASEYWDLSLGWDGALNLAENGWKEGADAVQPLAGRLFESLSSRMSFETWTPADEGEFFSVEDVLAGEPECWRSLRTVDGEGQARKRVQIAVSGCASAGVHAEALAARGAAICALIDLLETAGFGVKVDVCFATGSGEIIADTVQVKGYDDRGDMGMLAFWLGHPAALRRIGFAGWEGRPREVRDRVGINRGAGYGRVQDAEERFIGYKPDLMMPGPDLYIPGTYGTWTDPRGAEGWIKKTLEQFGVRFLD